MGLGWVKLTCDPLIQKREFLLGPRLDGEIKNITDHQLAWLRKNAYEMPLKLDPERGKEFEEKRKALKRQTRRFRRNLRSREEFGI